MWALGRNETTRPGSSGPRNSSSAAQLGEHVGVRRLDALRRPGRARRVDQREDVVGPDRAPASPRSRGPGRGRARRAPRPSDDVGAVPGSRSANAPLDDRDPVAGVAEQVLDLLGRARVVDAERRRAEVDRREVDDVELGPVDHHQPDGVAAAGRPAGAARARRARPRRAAARRSARSRRPACGPRPRRRVCAAVIWNASHSERASSASGREAVSSCVVAMGGP